jgi:nitric-oxide synthase
MQLSSDSSLETLLNRAERFLEDYCLETGGKGFAARVRQVRGEIDATGTYVHTDAELVYGAKAAWRNSNRCIGRIHWNSLQVRDCRSFTEPEEILGALADHLRQANHGGKLQPVISIFRPRHPRTGDAIRIWNAKLIRYAGYRTPEGIVGDPEEAAFTEQCQKLGWHGRGGRFDVLPVVLEISGRAPILHTLPKDSVLEVEMEHPEFPWFKDLGLKWYAVPVITNMVLEIGGLHYTAAPFNGWFMETEIGARNFGDEKRYHQLPVVAERMGLDTRSDRSLWKDRALIELNQAVLYSFSKAGVRLVDHHAASRQFMSFCKSEAARNRAVNADWSWIVPPISGSAVPVFHGQWANDVRTPNFFYTTPPWREESGGSFPASCPFHVASRDSN